MATSKYIPRSRSEVVRELASIAVAARKAGDKATWQAACSEWSARATEAGKRKAPASITRTWRG